MRHANSYLHIFSTTVLLLCALVIGSLEVKAQEDDTYFWQMVDKPGDSNFLYINDNNVLTWGTQEEAESNKWRKIDYSRFAKDYASEWHANLWNGVFYLVSESNQIVRRKNEEPWGYWSIEPPLTNDDDIVSNPAGMMKLSGTFDGYETYVYAFPSWNATYPCNPTDNLVDDNGNHYTHVRFFTGYGDSEWFINRSRYFEFDEGAHKTYLQADANGNLVRIDGDECNQKWKIKYYDEDKTSFLVQNNNGQYITLENGVLKATTDQSKATPLTGVEDDEGNKTVALWIDGHYLDATEGQGTKTQIKLVNEPVTTPTTEKTILHRVHQLVRNAQEIKAANPNAIPDGFLDGSKEWDVVNGHQYQYTSVYEFTHYVVPGQRTQVYFPMIQYGSGILHRDYQRFYDYQTDGLLPEGVLDLGSARTITYANGVVSGIRIQKNEVNDSPNNYVNNDFFVTLPAGTTSLDIACDVSNYTDMEWSGNAIKTEPSISQRVVWHLRSASELADELANLESGKFLEEKTIHFPARSVNFEPDCVGLEHEIANYWYYGANGTLRSLGEATGLQIVLDDNGTGITLTTGDNNGIRKHIRNEAGLVYNNHKAGGQDNFVRADARFISFTYPGSGAVSATGPDNPAYIYVYANGQQRYPVAKFTLIFDEGTSTLPWMDVLQEGKMRSPVGLAQHTGNKPIASVTFDYPAVYENSVEGVQNMNVPGGWVGSTIPFHKRTYNSSQLALDFVNANYMHSTKWYDDENGWKNFGANPYNLRPVMPATHNVTNSDNRSYYYDCKWGEYVLTSETGFWNCLGPFLGVNNNRLRQNDAIDNYLFKPADGMVPGFLYVDASERAGRVVTVPFEGNFCAGNKLYCSGWITTGTAYLWNDGAAPSSVILTVIGRDYNPDGSLKKEKALYRFCPGQISLNMRHENGSVELVSNANPSQGNSWVLNNDRWLDEHESGPWQQFYFEFEVHETFDRFFLDVDNNCVSTTGGDFMLDDIQIFASIPTVKVDRSTPLCVKTDAEGNPIYDAKLLKMEVPFENELEIVGVAERTTEVTDNSQLLYKSFAILEKDKFLTEFKNQLSTMGEPYASMTKAQIEDGLAEGIFESATFDQAYAAAFRAGQIGNEDDKDKYWSTSKIGTTEGNPSNVGICEFVWSPYYESTYQPEYHFDNAVTNPQPIYRREVDIDGVPVRYLAFNGNVSSIEWKTYTDYYVISSQIRVTPGEFARDFDLRSRCTKIYSFQLRPPLELKGIELNGDDNAVACENQIPTLLANMEVYMADETKEAIQNINFDWFIGKRPNNDDPQGVKADLPHFNANVEGQEFSPREALMNFRLFYPEASSLTNIEPKTETVESTTYELTAEMITALRQLVDDGQLVLRSRVLNVPVKKWAEDDPYTYLIAIPIHDSDFDVAIYGTTESPSGVVLFCDEPQPLKIAVEDMAPRLDAGFEAGMNGVDEYDYSANNGILSVRLARMGQFQKVQHGNRLSLSADGTKLWVPIRGAVGSSEEVIGVKHNWQMNDRDPYVYLTETTDPYFQQKVAEAIEGVEGKYPVGTVFDLMAVDPNNDHVRSAKDVNRLGIYFWNDFTVRDGYTYTLKIPFVDDTGGEEYTNACEGHMLLNLKIVPDYEVWMGTADNFDWNNDDNWRRADADDLLLRAEGKAPNSDETYLTNESNGNHYGFAPLYCTHLLIMTPDDELKYDDGGLKRGNYSPSLYDMYDGEAKLTNAPFPNLRSTATNILKYDFQARPYEADGIHKGQLQYKDKAQEGDYIAEMYEINKCQDIVFQHHTELLNAHLLSYDKAWVEYSLGKNQWHLVGSPLQDVVSGEWYAPSYSARQETTYFEPVTFGVAAENTIQIRDGGVYYEGNTPNRYDIRYDRFSPAVYQRSWDKAKAVLYEKGSLWRTTDGVQNKEGSANTGEWSADRTEWDIAAGDDYLQRIAYRPMGNGKANVAVMGTWSGTYNDAAVRYAGTVGDNSIINGGGFSVMPINTQKNNDRKAEEHALFRLPKEDQYYDTWDFGKKGKNAGSRVYIDDGRELPVNEVPQDQEGTLVETPATADNTISLPNRGRLRTDYFAVLGTEGIENGKILEKLVTDDKAEYKVTLKNEGSGSTGMFLACNPFICGLDMEKFFEVNTNVSPFYLILEDDEVKEDANAAAAFTGEWTWKEVKFRGVKTADAFVGQNIVAPRYAFFIRTADDSDLNELTIKFTRDMMVRTYGTPAVAPSGSRPYMSIRASRNGRSSEAHVMVHSEASNKFLPEEDMESLIDADISADIPVVFTMTGRLATSINRLHDFTCLPLGIESNSEDDATLHFDGVDQVGDNLQLYDALLDSFTPLKNGTTLVVPGQTLGRYYIVMGIDETNSVSESSVNVFATNGEVHVVSAGERIDEICVYNASGQLVYTATPQIYSHVFTLPSSVYVVKAKAGTKSCVRKLIVK